jgi:lysozyme
MSAAGLATVKEFEGLRLKAYKCPASVWTIGYGHTSAAGAPIVTPELVITKDEAEEVLARDMEQYEEGVRKYVKVDLTQGQFDALVDFAYNAGVGALQKSTLLKKVNAEKFDEVPAEFMKWTKGGGKELPGLVRRRRAEVKLWRGLETEKPVCNDEARAEPDLPIPKKSIMQSKEANGAVIAGGAGAIAVVQEVMPIVKEGGNILSAMSGTALVCLVIMVAAGAIWYFRKQRLDEDGA